MKNTRNVKKYSFENIDFINSAFLVLTPILLLIFGALWIEIEGFNITVVAFSVITYILSGISITAGYHRLFAHKTYDSHPVVKILFLIFGATAFQNSVLKWASDHRQHHSKVDTNDDPYNINEGFFFAHMGWILLEKNSHVKERYAKDMMKDKLIMWQHNNYLAIAVVFGVILPIAICYLLTGGLYGAIAACLFRIVFVHHCTFFINSLCHCFGSRPYTDTNTAKDNWFMAFLTFGEGYHNFHHFFQTDFRNGIRWYHFDPTKWLINILSWARLASNLKVTSAKRILDAKLSMSIKRIENKSIFNQYQTEFDEIKLKIMEAFKEIENFKNELKTKKSNLDKLSLKLAKLKVQEAKKVLRIQLVLWQLSIQKVEQNYA